MLYICIKIQTHIPKVSSSYSSLVHLPAAWKDEIGALSPSSNGYTLHWVHLVMNSSSVLNKWRVFWPATVSTQPSIFVSLCAITFSCAAIQFPTVYNLQCHQRPVPLIPCLFGVGAYRYLESVKSVCSGFLLLISYLISHNTSMI